MLYLAYLAKFQPRVTSLAQGLPQYWQNWPKLKDLSGNTGLILHLFAPLVKYSSLYNIILISQFNFKKLIMFSFLYFYSAFNISEQCCDRHKADIWVGRPIKLSAEPVITKKHLIQAGRRGLPLFIFRKKMSAMNYDATDNIKVTFATVVLSIHVF